MSGEDSSAIRKQDSCSSPLLPRGHSGFRPHCVERDNLKMNKGKFQQTRCFFLLEEEEQIFLPAAKTIRLYNYQIVQNTQQEMQRNKRLCIVME